MLELEVLRHASSIGDKMADHLEGLGTPTGQELSDEWFIRSYPGKEKEARQSKTIYVERMLKNRPELIPDDFNKHRTWEVDGIRYMACWYPQMGGYAGYCIVETSGECFDVYVWHDGEFPFAEGDRQPIRVHHCLADQFVEFGQLVKKLQEGLR